MSTKMEMERISPQLTTSQIYEKLFDLYKNNARSIVPEYATGLGENEIETCYRLALLSNSPENNDMKEQIQKLGGFKVVVEEIVNRAVEKAGVDGYSATNAVKYTGVQDFLREIVAEKENQEKTSSGQEL